jgi:peptide methionine sulfoxide reductase MsrB
MRRSSRSTASAASRWTLLMLLAAAAVVVPPPRLSAGLGFAAAWSSSPSFTRRDVLAAASSASLLAGATALAPSAAVAVAVDEAGPTAAAAMAGGTIRYGAEAELMRRRSHGTTDAPVQEDLMYGVSRKLADTIVSYNRRFAEPAGYFEATGWAQAVKEAEAAGKGPVTFYDSVSGRPLFVAPVGRSAKEFLRESAMHGWPSFRDAEVVWDNVRVLRNSGETVSVGGSHLGHNLPDSKGNRYCINLVSIAGRPSPTQLGSGALAQDL